jgi:DNA mismatch endonuclease (patch repair protein)
MAGIRATGNRSTELALVALFRAARITGWRRHSAMRGNPDFVFREGRLAVFVDGCFWHGCPLHGSQPKSHQTYWSGKIARNRKRDRSVTRDLRSRGWRVLRVWEHELRKTNWSRLVRRFKIS